MPKCLGIYIEDDVIKYAKVDKNKDIIKVDNFNIVFYEKENLSQTINKIIAESFSTRDIVSINISNEIYNYFEVFSAIKPNDKNKSVDLDFELLCNERGYDKKSLEARYIYRTSIENADKERVIHVAANKENVHKRLQEFNGSKVVSMAPITTSIYNLLEPNNQNQNIVIVNIEKDTKITTIINGEVYDINVISDGMGDILTSINNIENSLKKSYECCKNTTIYTQDMQDLQIEENDHLEDIMPVLYRIVNNVKAIVDNAPNTITKVYLTGLGTSINNVDLYFQEYITSVKCELLKPFFIENTSIKIPIKDYMEVNSAIALALDGLGYGNKKLSFKSNGSNLSDIANMEITGESVVDFFKSLVDYRKPLTVFDKTLLRLIACMCVAIIGYFVLSSSILDQIGEKKKEIEKSSTNVDTQIATITAQTAKVNAGESNYQQLITALKAIEKDKNKTSYSEEEDESSIESTVIEKDSIPNLLNRIVYLIPTQVTVTSIENTNGTHIVINAQAEKYEQLGFFKALISTEEVLLNVKSTSGSKSGDTITITIEGDLP